jgi:hypothetical protein
MPKYLKTAFVRDLEIQVNKEELSYNRMLELIQEEVIKNYKEDNTMIKKINRFFKDVWLGIDIANKNYLNGKSQWGKF